MIYIIDDRYYVNIGSMIYSEVIPRLDKSGNVQFVIANRKKELYNTPNTISMEEIKERLKEKTKEEKTNKRITRW